MVIAPEIEAAEGDEVKIAEGKVFNKTTGTIFEITPLPPARQAIIDAGRLTLYARKKLLERRVGASRNSRCAIFEPTKDQPVEC